MLDCLFWAFESNSLSGLFKFSKCVSQSFFFVVFDLFVCRFPLRCLYQPVNARMNYQESEYFMKHYSRSVQMNQRNSFMFLFFPTAGQKFSRPFLKQSGKPKPAVCRCFPALLIPATCTRIQLWYVYCRASIFFLIGPRHLNYYK